MDSRGKPIDKYMRGPLSQILRVERYRRCITPLSDLGYTFLER
jgi:hypothetical protein